MSHIYKGKNKPVCCDKSLLESENPVYYHVFEVRSGKTNKVLEKIKYTLTDAIKFAKEHLEEEPYIKDCLYEKDSNKEVHNEVVWTAEENIDDEICFYCRKNASKADLKEVGVGNEHVKLCPNCRWLLGTRRITLRDIADRLPSNMSSKNPDRITFQPGVYGNTYTESYNEATYVYIVHSDINENNIYAEFATEEEAIDYAKRHKDELTYVDKAEVALDENGYIDEVFDSETIWVYNEDYDFEKSEEDNPFELDFYDYNFPLDEGVKLRTKAEQDEFFRLCNEIGIYTSRDLENFMKEVDCTPETLLQALRDYRAELGPDFKIINEEANLVEDYELDEISVAEIKAELDYNGEVWFTDEVDESDEDGWRGASDFIIVDMGNGKYEGYRNWTDQEGEDLEYGSEEYFDNFEEVLYFIDGKYAKITDLNEYIGSELAEGLEEAIKMTRDEMIEKEGTDNVDLINAGREEEDRVELAESQSQEISQEYNRLSKKYGIDFEDLVYGEKGFMKTKYPDNFPDFAGDVIYSEKYWNELVDFAKEKGIELNEKLEEIYYPGGNVDSSYERLDWDVERDFINKYERNRKANWRKALGSSSGGNITTWSGRDNSGSSANSREGYHDWEDLPSIREVLVDTDGGYYVLIKMGGTNLSEKQVEMVLDCCFPDLEINYEFNKNKIYFRLKNENQLLA